MLKVWQGFALSWAWLLILTLVSVAIGLYYQSTAFNRFAFISIVMLIIAMKGQQIIDIFMELKHAPRLWRSVMLAYVIIIPLIITFIYL
ncbi:Cytochrome C oxidase subunit IV [Colwellia chukchiensis]|uniref:Cytochrome C oxidase subunit IV n=1 Tax=Colwellia chukchiensis TaxID=641665 RepID=A0A1H7KNV0_9GAMM|nr:cytochrome C oxidase subunit IV family protein [Colwellia chukchiensis]SEK88408.1 Cytochrome C oxidase subunit IV [Colwellia chukchiensis]